MLDSQIFKSLSVWIYCLLAVIKFHKHFLCKNWTELRWLPFVIGAEEFESVDALLLCMLDLVLGLLLRLSLMLLEKSLFVFLEADLPFHSEASGHKIVKWKQEPLFAPCDSAHMLPPMASTNLLQIAKPRPDPPWFRCFDWSTYVWIILINLCANYTDQPVCEL